MALELFLPYLNVTNIALIVSGLFLVVLFRRKNANLPPGPMGFPVLGSIPFINPKAEKTFATWAKKYGSVFSVNLGSHLTVVLNSHEAINQAFNKQSRFNGRYSTYFTHFACEGFGIMFLDVDEMWKTQRRFGSRALGGASLNGKSIEARVLEEANLLCDVIRSKQGQPFILEHDLMGSIADVINGITMMQRCTDGNERFRSYAINVVDGFRRDGFIYSMLSVIPWCRFLPFVKKHLDKMKQGLCDGNALFDEFIGEHEKEFDPKDIRDFTDSFIAEHKQNTPSFENFKQLRYFLKDLFAAGTETTTSTIRWAILYLIEHLDIQERVHEEIDRVLGHNGRVRMDLDLPFTKAVIQEVFRIQTATPLGVPRRTTEDASLMGFHIPKNTQVLANLWAVHNDPDVWPDPRRFDPGRHLDEEGQFVKSPLVIPFSLGGRNCLGENLARTEVFLFVVSILQKFRISSDPSQPPLKLEGPPGIVNSAPHHLLIAEER